MTILTRGFIRRQSVSAADCFDIQCFDQAGRNASYYSPWFNGFHDDSSSGYGGIVAEDDAGHNGTAMPYPSATLDVDWREQRILFPNKLAGFRHMVMGVKRTERPSADLIAQSNVCTQIDKRVLMQMTLPAHYQNSMCTPLTRSYEGISAKRTVRSPGKAVLADNVGPHANLGMLSEHHHLSLPNLEDRVGSDNSAGTDFDSRAFRGSQYHSWPNHRVISDEYFSLAQHDYIVSDVHVGANLHAPLLVRCPEWTQP